LNILVNSSYRAVITDFGSARIRRSVARENGEDRTSIPRQPPAVGGTVALTAPEVKFNPSTLDLTLTGPKFSLRWTAPEVLNDGMQDLQSDMWAMGWICWEIITGRIPFEELDREVAIIMHTMHGQLPAIRKDTELSHVLKLCSIMSDCWRPEPVKRIDASTFQRRVHMMPSETPSASTLDGQKARSAGLLVQLGNMYHAQDDREMAEQYYRSAIDVATRTRNDATKANALINLGNCYAAQSKNAEAIEALMQARDIHRRTGGDKGTANTLNGLGQVYRAQSKNHEAEQAFTDALKVFRRIGHNPGAASALEGLGQTYRAQSKHSEAATAFAEAREIHSRIGDDQGTARALDGLGNICRLQSKYPEAEKALQEAHDIHKDIGHELGAANALQGLGRTYQDQLKYHDAEEAFRKAHEIQSRVGN
ncbi:hypothetical protein FRC00_014546, partial [Tulasnella sp. 408]